jgi:protein associated with RNAse G/E
VREVREAGESCAIRYIVDGRVWLAQSVIVVKDGPQASVLLLLPGAQCAYPVGYRNWRDKQASGETRWQEARHPVFIHTEVVWQTNRVLIFLEPEKYYSCFLFWEHASGQFDSYYINFQLPFRRSHSGFDTLDLDLDIVIDPQYHWEWKDVDEYQEGIREGGIRDEWVKSIERSQPEVFDRINRRSYPLDGSWLDWQPDPGWAPPRLPEGWQVV